MPGTIRAFLLDVVVALAIVVTLTLTLAAPWIAPACDLSIETCDPK